MASNWRCPRLGSPDVESKLTPNGSSDQLMLELHYNHYIQGMKRICKLGGCLIFDTHRHATHTWVTTSQGLPSGFPAAPPCTHYINLILTVGLTLTWTRCPQNLNASSSRNWKPKLPPQLAWFCSRKLEKNNIMSNK